MNYYPAMRASMGTWDYFVAQDDDARTSRQRKVCH